MNKIEQLLEKYCPDGVEFKELGEVCEFKKGKNLVKKDIIPGKIPVIAGGREPISFHNEFNRDYQVVTISSSGAYSGFVSFWDEPIFLTDAFSISSNELLLIKYIFYFLKSKQDKIYKMQKGGGVPHVYAKDIAKIQIPIPPIEIQQEIVKILDTFTQLEAELEAELEARKKQYEYYRDEMLSFEDDEVEWKELGELMKIKHGKDYKKLGEGNIPVYGSGGIMTFVDSFVYDKPTVLIPRKGTITNLFYIEEPFWNVDTIYYTIIDTNNIIPKYFYYFMKTINLASFDTGSGRPSLTMQILNKIKIPLPSLQKQQEIVDVLDKFDALVNDISSGLPAEIKARKQQYEYYREKLLTFKELGK